MTCSFSKEFSSSSYTNVENAFIYQYLPVSDGNAVKVYLYGLFLCQNPTYDQPLSSIAEVLQMDVKEVEDCFKFWEEFGLVNVISKDPFTVTYVPIRATALSKPKKYKAEKYTEFTKDLQSLLPSRMISTGEYTEYFNIMETFNIKPDAMITIVKYCVDRKGDDIGYRYISKVAKDFGSRGIVTLEKVEKELSSYISRTNDIQRILHALSLKRQPEYEDLALLKKWTGELNFEIDNVVFAASKIKKGSMAKLDEFMMELYSIKSFSKEEIDGFIKNKQKVFDLAVKINKALSVYMEVIDPVIDTYTNKWLSFGYTEDALLFIASYCFKEDKRSLRDMDQLIDGLRLKGVITLTSISDYFQSLKSTDEFIEKLLLTAGVNRRPTPWDRENLNTWKMWNFSEEMILESAKISSGKSSPIAYMNGVLSNWKNNGIFRVEDVDKSGVKSEVDSQEEYNKEYERRRSLAISKAQKNMEKALSNQEFSDVYSRLNGIEKDLAFASIDEDDQRLKALNIEKAELTKKSSIILKSMGLTLEDLYPKYACKKCNDTGYVGSNRCDCF